MPEQHFIFKSMKRLLFAFQLLIISGSVYSQYIRIDWQHCYTYNYKEAQSTKDVVKAGNGLFILRDREENYPYGYTKIYLEKTDMNDNLLWSKYFSSAQGAGLGQIVKADENNFYIVGITSHGGGDVTYNPYENTINIWVIKIDSSGNKIWDKVFGGTGGDYPWDISVTTDGGVIIAATFASYYGGDYVGDATNYYGFWDFWVVKLNKDDDHIEWDFTLGSSETEYGQTVIATADGGCLAGGAVSSAPDGNVACTDESGDLITNAVLLKLNAQGELEWQKCFGSNEDDGAECMLETEDGYIIAGITTGDDLDLEGAGYHLSYDHNGNRIWDIWIYKIDKQGNLLWSKCFGGSSYESPDKLFQTSNGDIIVFGVTQSIDGDVTLNYPAYEGYKKIWMLKLSAQGDLLWQRCIGNGGDQEIADGAAMLDDHNFIIAADSQFGSSGDLTCGTNYDSTGLDFSWIAHITDTTGGYGLGWHETSANRYIKVCPNPANEYAVFRYTLPAETREALLQIRDLSGRPVETLILQGREGEKLWDARDVSAGIYIYSLKAGKLSVNGKLAVVK